MPRCHICSQVIPGCGRTNGCTRGGVRVRDDGWVTRCPRDLVSFGGWERSDYRCEHFFEPSSRRLFSLIAASTLCSRPLHQEAAAFVSDLDNDAPAAAVEPAKQTPLLNAGLWAGIGVTSPIMQRHDMQDGKSFMICWVANDGDVAVDPDVGSSQLFVNGKELKDWKFIVASCPTGVSNFEPLRPGDFLEFGYAMGARFWRTKSSSPQWKGQVFRVGRSPNSRVLLQPEVKIAAASRAELSHCTRAADPRVEQNGKPTSGRRRVNS